MVVGLSTTVVESLFSKALDQTVVSDGKNMWRAARIEQRTEMRGAG